MARQLLYIAVVVLLVLSGAALVFGILLFQQRETLKGRTQKLEQTIKQVAGTIETSGESTDKLTIPDDQLKTFKTKAGGPPAMDVPLKQLEAAAQAQLDRLNSTRTELADTKTTLAKTQSELKISQADLASEKARTKELTETVAARDATISEKTAAIEKLEGEKKELADNFAALQTQVDDLEVEKRDLTDTLAVLQEKVQKLESEADARRGVFKLAKGEKGIVRYVNLNWNFIVFEIAPTDLKYITPQMELLIQRSDKLVGKIKVASVVDSLAIAEILTDWEQKPLTIAKGDYVIY